MSKKRKIRLAAALLLLAAGSLGCGKKESSSNEALYGSIIANLGDEDQFALVDMGLKYDVLLVTDQTYDDGNGHHAALFCTVYYASDGEAKEAGTLESMGTAYPISYGNHNLYAASGNRLSMYEIDEKTGLLWETAVYEARCDEDGDESWYCIKEQSEQTISEEDYLDAWKVYEESQVVSFGYGAAES